MTSPYIKRHILTAIEHLRARKARPDLHRICNQLKRRHNCTNSETTRCIDNLIDMGIVIKVEYKGSMSYRDASKWKKGHVAGHIMNSSPLVAKIQGAIDAIMMARSESDSTPDGRAAVPGKCSEKGATPEEIEAWFKKQTGENACHLCGDALFEVLTREVETNSLKKSPEDGTYTVGKRARVTPRQRTTSSSTPAQSEPDLEEKPMVQIVSNGPVAEPPPPSYIDDKRQRPPSGRKRFCKFPDEIYEVTPIKKSRKQPQPQSQAMDPPAIKPEPKVKKESVPMEDEYRLASLFRMCNEIHQTEVPSRHAGQEAEMLVCCGCQMKVHPSCLCYSQELLLKIDRDTWRCVTCKKCAKCDLLLRTPSPMTCSGCDLAYHKACHKPSMRKKPKDNWLCMRCTGSEVKTSKLDVMGLEKPSMFPGFAGENGNSNSNSIKEECYNESEQNNNAEENGNLEEDSSDSIPPSVKTAKDTSFPPTPNASPMWDVDKESAEMLGIEPEQIREDQKVKKVSKFDGRKFPDPTNWSVDEVYQFVRDADACYAEAAEALKREEIDGEALMCLKREEILSNFALKVGPALKLHRFITNMRTGGNAHMYV